MSISSIAWPENWTECDSSAVILFGNASFVLFQGLQTGQIVVSPFALPIIILQVFFYICHFVNLVYMISRNYTYFRWRGGLPLVYSFPGACLLSLNNSETCQFIALIHFSNLYCFQVWIIMSNLFYMYVCQSHLWWWHTRQQLLLQWWAW
jgi:hypothetical protein